MAAGDWNFLAAKIVGDGTIDIVADELPIDITSIRQALSAPSLMDGTISHALERLKSNGRPIFEPWNTVILAEASDILRGMTIYRKPTFNGQRWQLDQIGLPGYPQGMLYDGDQEFIDTDPLDIFRHIWNHLQSRPHGNLGVTIDQLTSTVRVGTPVQDVNFTTSSGTAVSFEAGPRKLNWWSTTDLGQEIDKYAKETPFDWLEQVYWDGDTPRCHIKLGYPIIGGRRTGPRDPRLILGENLATEPTVTTADLVSEVHTLGAGEGRDRVRGYAGVNDGRVRRAKVIDDKDLDTVTGANALASTVLNGSRGQAIVETLEIYDHPNARLTGISLGDEIPLYAETSWIELDTFVRVVAKEQNPQHGDRMTLTVVRTDVA